MPKILPFAAFAAILCAPIRADAQGVEPAIPSVSVGGTIAVTNTYQSILPFNTGRRGCLVVNKGTNAMRLNLDSVANATDAKAVPLAAGASFNCRTPGGMIVADELSITGTAADAYVVIRQ